MIKRYQGIFHQFSTDFQRKKVHDSVPPFGVFHMESCHRELSSSSPNELGFWGHAMTEKTQVWLGSVQTKPFKKSRRDYSPPLD